MRLTTTAELPRRDEEDGDDERDGDEDDAARGSAFGSGLEQIRQFWRKRP
jgi:hypothetical protein